MEVRLIAPPGLFITLGCPYHCTFCSVRRFSGDTAARPRGGVLSHLVRTPVAAAYTGTRGAHPGRRSTVDPRVLHHESPTGAPCDASCVC